MTLDAALTQLETLELPPVMPGERPPLRPTEERTIWYFDPEGYVIPGTIGQAARRFAAYRMRRGNYRRDVVEVGNTKVEVSTIYWGIDLDHSPEPNRPAMLWETAIFGLIDTGAHNWHYVTRAAAMSGHDRIMEILTQAAH